MKLYNKFALLLLLTCSLAIAQERVEDSQVIIIHSIGDSTMAIKPNPDENPERGWAQMLPGFLSGNIALENYAVNGRSTRSFITEGRWEKVLENLKMGDYVFIQFGHNDQKENDPKRYTNPHTAYRANLIRFVEDSRAKGAIPVLFTSIVRRNYNENGTLVDTHGDYPVEVRQVAQEYNVPLIDLQYQTELLVESFGQEDSKDLYLHYKPKEIAYYPEGKEDDTHLSVLGATHVARLAVASLIQKVPALSVYLKAD